MPDWAALVSDDTNLHGTSIGGGSNEVAEGDNACMLLRVKPSFLSGTGSKHRPPGELYLRSVPIRTHRMPHRSVALGQVHATDAGLPCSSRRTTRNTAPGSDSDPALTPATR